MNYININAETISAIMTTNTKIDSAYTLNSNRSIMEKTWQGVGDAIGLPPTDVPNGMWCVNPSGNPVYVQAGDICADGSFKIPMDFGWCEAPIASCPNLSWALSEDKKTCSRPDFSCIINPDKYQHGFHFIRDEHNIFDVLEPPSRNIVTKKGRYDYEYESVAAHGKTIFWKLNNNFLKATGNKQCQ